MLKLITYYYVLYITLPNIPVSLVWQVLIQNRVKIVNFKISKKCGYDIK
jgi:hypothetical protein